MMKKFMFILSIAIILHNAALASTCREVYENRKKELILSKGKNILAGLGIASGIGIFNSFITGAIGSGVFFAVAGANAAVTGGVLLVITGTGDVVKGIKNGRMNKMIKLIDQSDSYLEVPGKKPGKFLSRLYKNLKKKELSEISVEQLAKTISKANKSGELCRDYTKFYFRNLDERIENGEISVVKI